MPDKTRTITRREIRNAELHMTGSAPTYPFSVIGFVPDVPAAPEPLAAPPATSDANDGEQQSG